MNAALDARPAAISTDDRHSAAAASGAQRRFGIGLRVRFMCNLYYADLWIMPTIGSERARAAAIAAMESA